MTPALSFPDEEIRAAAQRMGLVGDDGVLTPQAHKLAMRELAFPQPDEEPLSPSDLVEIVTQVSYGGTVLAVARQLIPVSQLGGAPNVRRDHAASSSGEEQ